MYHMEHWMWPQSILIIVYIVQSQRHKREVFALERKVLYGQIYIPHNSSAGSNCPFVYIWA
jgi:hypothetical protein